MDHNLAERTQCSKPSRRSLLPRHLPPTAFPVEGQDLWQGILSLIKDQNSHESLRLAILRYTGCSGCFLVSSGRAALTLVLLTLKKLSHRRNVIIPAYTCPTVVQSVLAAELKPVFCDVSPDDLSFDSAMLSNLLQENTLTVLPTHLYGYAQDIRNIMTQAQSINAFVVEDAAQAFGATFDGKTVGTLGDAGISSMGRGKCIPTGHGGIILANQTLSPLISEVLRDLNITPIRFDVFSLLFFIAYGLGTHPIGWWFITRSPLNPAHEGMNIGSLPPIQIKGYSSTQSAIGLSLLKRLPKVQEVRRRNAQKLMRLLQGFDFIKIPTIHSKAKPVFLRFPIITDTETKCRQLYTSLWKQGIGVSKSYYRTLPDLYPEYRNHRKYPGAEHLANCLLTLPTHPGLKEMDFLRVFQTLQQISETNHGG